VTEWGVIEAPFAEGLEAAINAADLKVAEAEEE
jgi:hypothetical protein